MQKKILEFATILRQSGIRVSVSEAIEKTGEITVLMDVETTLMQAQSSDESDNLMIIQKELEQLELEDKMAEQALLES